MEKINFVNNSEPYLSAENLNQLQTNIENAINSVNNKVKGLVEYTADETMIGTREGKPHYRKILHIASLPNTAETTYEHGITDLDRFTHIYGTASMTKDGKFYQMSLPNANPTNLASCVSLGVQLKDSISIITGSDRSAWGAEITLEYIKENNITWNGDTTGRETYDYEGVTLYKVSDLTATREELIGKTVVIGDESSGDEMVIQNEFLLGGYSGGDLTVTLYGNMPLVVIVTEGTEHSTGMYFLNYDGVYTSALYLE